MAKRGRKEKTFEEYVKPKLDDIVQWAKDGLIEKDICKRLGIGVTKFNDLKKEFNEINKALKDGKAVADYHVERSLYKRANGYEYEETKIVVDEKGKKRVEKTTKHVVPDVTAQIFWLKNRKPKDWKDKRDLDLTSDGEKLEINVNLVDNEQ